MDVDGDSYRGWENPATRPNVYELLKEQIDMHRCTEGEGEFGPPLLSRWCDRSFEQLRTEWGNFLDSNGVI